MPFEWKLASLDELKALLLDTPLQDSQIRVNLATIKVQQPISLGLEALSFVVDGGAETAIEAFNAPGDVDADGVIGDKPAQEDVSKLSPPLVLGQDAWLKYGVRVRAKAQAGVNMPFLSGSASGEVSLYVADYHVHSLTESLRDALNKDTKNLRLPLVLDHVLKLQPKEALSFQARTRLETSLSLSWADVFTSNLNALSRLLPAGTLLALKTSVGASVSGSVSVADDFILTFSREQAGSVVVSVQKGAVRSAKLAAQIGVTVEAASADVMGAVLDALVGLPGLSHFEALIDKLSTTPLNDEEKKLLRLALDRLGLTDYEADASALKRAWEDQKARAKQALTTLAAEKISAGFQYEYSRLSDEQTLMRMVLTDEQLKGVHTSLVLGRMSQVLKQVDPSVMRSYFQQASRTLSEAWGFTLGFSKWQMLHSQGQKKLQRVTQFGSPDSVHGPRKYAYVGVRSYEGGFFQDRGGWSVDFKCDMGEFKSEPSVRDFNFGLYLLLRRSGKMSETSLRQAIDEAIVWHVLDDADEEQVLQQIQAAAKGGPVELRLEVKLADPIFRELTSLVAFGQPEFFAKALARSMPWDTSRARSAPEFRQGVYAPLWMAYLTEKAKDWTPPRAAQRAAAWLKQDKIAKGTAGEVAFWEGTGRPNTFADVLDKNSRLADVGGMYGGTYVRWQRLVSGMARLKDGLLTGADPTLIDDVFSDLEELWRVSFHVKAFGAMLLDLSTKSVQGLKAVERTFTVVTGSGDQQSQLLFSASRAE
ncbi:hypothetical protein [Hyalangium versicolor]|uniref:hypothetical protein n=1 Tax=Hyalangium versicolor TaxID=2861190 RepID=UPI001CCF089A|nr:hypothetical protein [Hyalangium versicolor]